MKYNQSKPFFFLIILFTLILGEFAMAGAKYDPLNKPNTFRNKDNPFYWKNRSPHPGYWQQDVYYNIKAKLNDQTDIISAVQKLTYWNNSPDDLEYVFFHLYQNAFQPGSYLDNLQKNNGIKPKYGKYESKGLGTVVESIKVKGSELARELDNTILKVYLPEPLKSGESITLEMVFKTYFDKGSTRRRMKLFTSFGIKHYDGVLWYPRICVYDRKFGWTTDQHLGREFYGNFGSFDVELTLPHHYILGATGYLLNRDEVLPEDLRKKLKIENFKIKPNNSKPSVIIEPDSTKFKTWIYHTENVHDFAFTADPSYRIGEAEWKGIKCYSLAQEQHAAGWQNAAKFASKVIKVFSQDFGMYAYHKMIVADARDGMEYPMLTLDGGLDPDYRSLLAHEIGHSWFYGMVGNNETYRAALDEGFTQFLTVWGMDRIDGPYRVRKHNKSNFYNKYYLQSSNRDDRLYLGYLKDAIKGQDPQLNTHSDAFGGALRHGGGYRQVYSKTGTMLYNLEYVLGRDMFIDAIQHYFNQWKICHPYFEDFRNSIIQYTKVDLNWFFDQWLETSKNIDYSIEDVEEITTKEQQKINVTDSLRREYTYEVTFERKGRMHMPVDFEIFTKDEYACERYMFHIPNTNYIKNSSAMILKKWHGWDKLNPTYVATVTVPAEIHDVVIDPSYRMADVNMLNNSKKLPVMVNFDSRIENPVDWTVYKLNAAPNIWYNQYDGIKLGVHMNGNYMDYKHIFRVNAWFSTEFAQQGDKIKTGQQGENRKVSLTFQYKNAIDKISKNSNFHFKLRSKDGLEGLAAGIEKKDKKDVNTIYIDVKSMIIQDSSSLNYLLYPEQWGIGKFNNSINIGYQRKYKYNFGNGKINLDLRSSTIGSDYDYNRLMLTVKNVNKLGKFDVITRTFAQYTTGSNVANESALFLAGANPEAIAENDFTSAAGIFPEDWADYNVSTNYFHMGGGLNLRGYSGYYVAQEDPLFTENTVVHKVYRGQTGAAFNVEIEFDRFFRKGGAVTREHKWDKKKKKNFRFDSYLFGDAGIINYTAVDGTTRFSDVRMDGGIGFALSLVKLGVIEEFEPITVRFDIPLYLSHAPYAESGDNFQFRWILGINRAF